MTQSRNSSESLESSPVTIVHLRMGCSPFQASVFVSSPTLHGSLYVLNVKFRGWRPVSVVRVQTVRAVYPSSLWTSRPAASIWFEIWRWCIRFWNLGGRESGQEKFSISSDKIVDFLTQMFDFQGKKFRWPLKKLSFLPKILFLPLIHLHS